MYSFGRLKANFLGISKNCHFDNIRRQNRPFKSELIQLIQTVIVSRFFPKNNSNKLLMSAMIS